MLFFGALAFFFGAAFDADLRGGISLFLSRCVSLRLVTRARTHTHTESTQMSSAALTTG